MTGKFVITGFADEISGNLAEQIDGLKKLDVHYVEMRGADGNNLIYHTDEKVKEIKDRLDEAGISLSAMGTPLGKIGINEPFEKHFEDFKRAIEIAHKMGTQNIRMFSFYMPEETAETGIENAPAGQTKDHLGSGPDPFREPYKGQVFDRIGRFVDYASQNDVILLHENEKGIYGERAFECKELLQTFGGDHFKGIFDFANFVQARQNTLDAYEMLKDYIVYVHVKDALWEDGSVVPAGYGDGNVAAILGMLNEKGYEGFLSLEPHLFDFTGFAGLERGRNSMGKKEGRALSGFEAFSLAHESLLKILAGL